MIGTRATVRTSRPSGPARALDTSDDEATLVVGGEVVEVTSLDRVYWPADATLGTAAITKRDYLRYLLRVAARMLPHLAGRPLTLFRWPEGVAGRRVLMKHWEIRLPRFVERVDVYSESKSRPDQYILCNNLATLLWLGHMGTLEFHAWHSRVTRAGEAPEAVTAFADSLQSLRASTLERPDYLLFDIDPFVYTGREARAKQPEFSAAAFGKACDVALLLKATLDAMRVVSFVKTSGKTGLHVVVPIRRTLRYDAVREVATTVGRHLARAHPELVTVDWSVERRTGKVFVDVNMNVRGKSMTTPWSPRGLPGAPVSMPIRWHALPGIDPLQFRVGTLALAGDPWRGLAAKAQSLEAKLSSSAR